MPLYPSLNVMNKKERIGGPGQVVEIDESKFGKRKYHKGRHVEGQWVFGGVLRGTLKCFLVPVEKRDSATLLPIIKDFILPGTTIISDLWKAYNCLSEDGFKHMTVNHSITFKDSETGAHINTQEGLWKHAKLSLPQFHRKKSHFVGYLAKFMLMQRMKQNQQDPFFEFLKLAGQLYNPLQPRESESNEDLEFDDYEVLIE